MFIERIKKEYKPGQAILIESLLNLFPEYSRAYVFRLLASSAKQGELIRFARGVYCIPKPSFFGCSSLTPGKVAERKYIRKGKSVYGLYAGLTLLNQFGISSQIPNTVEIVTNFEATRKRIVEIKGMRFILRKSRLRIDEGNLPYYVILQLFSDLDDIRSLDNLSMMRIRDYMKDQRLQKDKLAQYAMCFPSRVSKRLLGSGILNEIADSAGLL